MHFSIARNVYEKCTEIHSMPKNPIELFQYKTINVLNILWYLCTNVLLNHSRDNLKLKIECVKLNMN